MSGTPKIEYSNARVTLTPQRRKEHPLYQPPFWNRFKHKQIRDLAWILFSEKLLSTTLGQFASFQRTSRRDATLAWLHQLDAENVTLVENSATLRLGIYVERLLESYLINGYRAKIHSYEIICSNLTIYENKRSIGELDFVLFDHSTNRFIHLELACKFYLLSHSSLRSDKQWNAWVGPNDQDRMDLKFHRMRDQQIPLSYAQSSQLLLVQNNIDPRNISREHLILGQRYLPLTKLGDLSRDTHQVQKFYWIRASSLKQQLIETDLRFAYVEKHNWLTSLVYPPFYNHVDEAPTDQSTRKCDSSTVFLSANELLENLDDLMTFWPTSSKEKERNPIQENKRVRPAKLAVFNKTRPSAITHIMVVEDHWNCASKS